jgi:hypothetical protein
MKLGDVAVAEGPGYGNGKDGDWRRRQDGPHRVGTGAKNEITEKPVDMKAMMEDPEAMKQMMEENKSDK